MRLSVWKHLTNNTYSTRRQATLPIFAQDILNTDKFLIFYLLKYVTISLRPSTYSPGVRRARHGKKPWHKRSHTVNLCGQRLFEERRIHLVLDFSYYLLINRENSKQNSSISNSAYLIVIKAAQIWCLCDRASLIQ